MTGDVTAVVTAGRFFCYTVDDSDDDDSDDSGGIYFLITRSG